MNGEKLQGFLNMQYFKNLYHEWGSGKNSEVILPADLHSLQITTAKEATPSPSTSGIFSNGNTDSGSSSAKSTPPAVSIDKFKPS